MDISVQPRNPEANRVRIISLGKILFGPTMGSALLLMGFGGFSDLMAAPPGKVVAFSSNQSVEIVQSPVKNRVLEKRGTGIPLILFPSTTQDIKLWDEVRFPGGSKDFPTSLMIKSVSKSGR